MDFLLDDNPAEAYGGLIKVVVKKVEFRWENSRAVEYDLASARINGAI